MGNECVIMPGKQPCLIANILDVNHHPLQTLKTGHQALVTLSNPDISLKKGSILCLNTSHIQSSTNLEASLKLNDFDRYANWLTTNSGLTCTLFLHSLK